MAALTLLYGILGAQLAALVMCYGPRTESRWHREDRVSGIAASVSVNTSISISAGTARDDSSQAAAAAATPRRGGGSSAGGALDEAIRSAVNMVERVNDHSKVAEEARDVERHGKRNVEEVLDVLNQAAMDELVEDMEGNHLVITASEIEELTGQKNEDSECGDRAEDCIQGDMLAASPEHKVSLLQRISAGVLAGTPWPGVIPYCFLSDVKKPLRHLVRLATEQISRAVPCIRFGEVKLARNQPSVKEWSELGEKKAICKTLPAIFVNSFDSGGCVAFVGLLRERKSQGVQLSWPGCGNLGTVIHELLHAVGLHHEQSRPDRGRYVRINWRNIKEEKKHNFELEKEMDASLPYDFTSVMHYEVDAFAKDKRQNTILVKGGHTIGQRIGMSQLDADKVARLYGGTCSAAHLNEMQRGCKDEDPNSCPRLLDPGGGGLFKEQCGTEEKNKDKCCGCGGGTVFHCWDGAACLWGEYGACLAARSGGRKCENLQNRCDFDLQIVCFRPNGYPYKDVIELPRGFQTDLPPLCERGAWCDVGKKHDVKGCEDKDQRLCQSLVAFRKEEVLVQQQCETEGRRDKCCGCGGGTISQCWERGGCPWGHYPKCLQMTDKQSCKVENVCAFTLRIFCFESGGSPYYGDDPSITLDTHSSMGLRPLCEEGAYCTVGTERDGGCKDEDASLCPPLVRGQDGLVQEQCGTEDHENKCCGCGGGIISPCWQGGDCPWGDYPQCLQITDEQSCKVKNVCAFTLRIFCFQSGGSPYNSSEPSFTLDTHCSRQLPPFCEAGASCIVGKEPDKGCKDKDTRLCQSLVADREQRGLLQEQCETQDREKKQDHENKCCGCGGGIISSCLGSGGCPWGHYPQCLQMKKKKSCEVKNVCAFTLSIFCFQSDGSSYYGNPSITLETHYSMSLPPFCEAGAYCIVGKERTE